MYGAELMKLHPPHVQDQPLLARMRRLGLMVGESFQAGADALDAIQAAPGRAASHMTAAQPHLTPVVNGWSQPTFGMGVYATGYLRRAIVAKVGLGANLVEDAVYPLLYLDDRGEAPNGDNDYVLHFAADALPPADAFWSVTMYDGEGFTVSNPLDRYAIGDRDPLQFNSDGSLDLYIQHEDPGNEKRRNWLPSPRGPIGVTMRIYSPRPEVLDGSWAPPPVRRAGS